MNIENHLESETRSLFILKSNKEELFFVTFQKLEIEEIDFDDEYIQNNVYDLSVVKHITNQSNANKKFCNKIYEIFCNKLNSKPQAIIYISIPFDSNKNKLINRYIDLDNNNHFTYMKFRADDKVFYIFQNTNAITHQSVSTGIAKYFKDCYGVEYMFDI